MDELTRAERLIEEAAALPYGDLKVQLLEEAVRHVDCTRDLDRMFDARMILLDEVPFCGHAEKTLTTFAWCLGQFEADPERFAHQEYLLLWNFKSVLYESSEFPQISLKQIGELRNQMARMYERAGYNMRSVHHTELSFAIGCGDIAIAEKSYAAMKSCRRDGMSDCPACEADTFLLYHDLLDDPQAAYRVARPSLEGKRTCAEVPHRTYNYILCSMAKLGMTEEGDEFRKKGYRLIRKNPSFLRQTADQMAYLVHRNEPARAAKILETHLSWALNTFELETELFFQTAARLVVERLIERKSRRQFKFTKDFPLYDPDGNYDSQAVLAWFDARIDELATQFNARSNTDYYTTRLPERMRY